MRVRLVALILAACAADPERGTEAFEEPFEARFVPERETPPPSRDDGPCGRLGTVVLPDGRVMAYAVPCRPYDRVRDLPRPADKVPESGR